MMEFKIRVKMELIVEDRVRIAVSKYYTEYTNQIHLMLITAIIGTNIILSETLL